MGATLSRARINNDYLPLYMYCTGFVEYVGISSNIWLLKSKHQTLSTGDKKYIRSHMVVLAFLSIVRYVNIDIY